MRIVVILDDKLVADAMRYIGPIAQYMEIDETLPFIVRLKTQNNTDV